MVLSDATDLMTWDGRADPAEVRALLEACRDPLSRAGHALGQLWDETAAPTLRGYLEDPHPRVRDLATRALGCCGSAAEDGSRLLALARATRPPSEAVLSTLTELDVPGTAELLRALLAEAEPGSERELALLDRLVWLRDPDVGDRLMSLVREHGFASRRPMTVHLAAAVLRVGTVAHRAELADVAVDIGRQVLVVDPVDIAVAQRRNWLRSEWRIYVDTAGAAGAAELADVYRRVDSSPEALTSGKRLTPVPVDERVVEEFADRVVPSSVLEVADGPDGTTWPPPKFLGQPDWRDEPAWPVNAAGEPLMFYGQLPLPGPESRTAYIFLDEGNDEWEPLGPGNAVVVQPGDVCHLDTIPLEVGPQEYTWESEERYRRRSRRVPHPEVHVRLVPGADPVSWDEPVNLPESGWAYADPRNDNKIGGTPRWLQGEEYPPGDGWVFLAQFDAEALATERGDCAVCYLWQHPDGRVAFGWQCA